MPGLDQELPKEASPSATTSQLQQGREDLDSGTSAGASGANDGSGGAVRRFTWKELGKLNQRHNAHVAYRGKVRLHVHRCTI